MQVGGSACVLRKLAAGKRSRLGSLQRAGGALAVGGHFAAAHQVGGVTNTPSRYYRIRLVP